MKEYLPLTPEHLAQAEERLRHPAPGSRIEAAHKFGLDLTLLIRNLPLMPAERVRNMQIAWTQFEGGSSRAAMAISDEAKLLELESLFEATQP